MPDCTLRYMPGPGREELAEALMEDLPSIIVASLRSGAGMRVTPKDLVIDIVERHAKAHNAPNLELTVMTGRGTNGRTYNGRAEVRKQLRSRLFAWFERHGDLCEAAKLGDFDAIVRFAESCGVNVDVRTGKPGSSWGGPKDN